ncbi:MAG TPA: SPOR domain-containing protein [Rhodanobacteraceae bacterium]|nr:SPOR domain-containing protein [Rhodanobacteraceae bacterium]
MDSSLKQRLLGAVVLIALAIIFVPMFLSGSGPKKESETLNLKIPPAPDREFQTRVLPVDNGTPSAGLPVQAAPPSVAPATVDTGKPPTSEPVTVVRAPPAETAGKPDADVSSTAAKPAAPAPGQAADSRFYVHLGVYAEAGNAQDLVAAIRRGGFPAFAEASTYQGKSAKRVRVGPYADRAAAEAARLKIRRLEPSVPGSVVELAVDAGKDAPPGALPANRAGGWAVQLGAFSTAEDANKLRDRLRNTGFDAFVDQATADGQTLWRVRAGPEIARADADKLRARIKDKLKIDGMLVTVQ